MAYVSKEDKAKIAAALKQVVPAGWKYSLAVQRHSTIVMTISAAPFDLIGAFEPSEYFNPETVKHVGVSNPHYRSRLKDKCVADTFEAIFKALNTDNYNNSDVMTDYHDVGHYVGLQIGKWDKPFVVTGDMAKHKENAST